MKSGGRSRISKPFTGSEPLPGGDRIPERFGEEGHHGIPARGFRAGLEARIKAPGMPAAICCRIACGAPAREAPAGSANCGRRGRRKGGGFARRDLDRQHASYRSRGILPSR
jgi:hypothetical protein